MLILLPLPGFAGAQEIAGIAKTQELRPGQSILDLPRPGYEIGRWQVGNALLLPSLSASASDDNNIYATSVGTIGDTVFDINPRLEIDSRGSDFQLTGDAYAHARLLNQQTNEDTLAFGGGANANYIATRQTRFSGGLHFDRDFLHRADPEASSILLKPALFNSLTGDAGFQWQGNKVLIGANASLQNVNYIDPLLDDRDQTIWRGKVRLGYILSAPIRLYVEPYVNVRNARLPVDHNGIDRDVTTIGTLAGVAFDITDRLKGELGAGGFKANPAGTLASFSGLAFNGKLNWSPSQRTLVSFTAFQGDVSTVQSGANGRIDMRLQLRLDQEVRHNLLLNASVAQQNTRYTGNLVRWLHDTIVGGELEYLATRNLSVFVNAAYETRSSNTPLERFNRTTAGIGVRLRV